MHLLIGWWETETVPSVGSTVEIVHSSVVRVMAALATVSFSLFSISPYHQFRTHIVTGGISLFPYSPHTIACVFTSH